MIIYVHICFHTEVLIVSFCLTYCLKRIPNGRWQCPKCCGESDTVELISNLDSISKRARTKVVATRPASSSGTKRMSLVFGGSFMSRKRSSSKTKSVGSQEKVFESKPDPSLMSEMCSGNPSNRSSSVSPESHGNDNVVLLGVSPDNAPSLRKLDSSHMEDPCLPQPSNSELEDEAVEKSTGLSCDLTQETKIVLAIGSIHRKVKKRKHMQADDKQKRSKNNNGNHDASKKHVPRKKAKTVKGNLQQGRKSRHGKVLLSALGANGGGYGLGDLTKERVSVAACFQAFENT